MTTEVILYDLPTKGSPQKPWSLNPWKVRLALNYMKIPYKTQWVEYPDIAPLFKDEFGLAPNSEGTPYTIPAARVNGKYIMDSKPIAAELQRLQASPSLRLDSASLAAVEQKFFPVLMPLAGVWLPRVPANLLGPGSLDYFVRTRSERLGPLEQFQRPIDDPKPWADAKPAIDELAAVFKQNAAGPFADGDQLGYADMQVAAMLHFFQTIDPAIYAKFVTYDKVYSDLYEAMKPYFEKDD